MIDIFSDASQQGQRFTGAFLIGTYGEAVAVHHACSSSTEAELLTMAVALRLATEEYPDAIFRVHTDLDSIGQILDLAENGHRWPAGYLVPYRHAGCVFVPDANKFQQHRICHRMARLAAGVRSAQYEIAVAPMRYKPPQPPLRAKRRAVWQALQVHPDGVSETRLAQESGQGLNTVHKVLAWLKTIGAAEVEFPAGSSGLSSLELWRWRPLELQPQAQMQIEAETA